MTSHRAPRVPELVAKAKQLKVSCGSTEGADVGALVSKEVLLDI